MSYFFQISIQNFRLKSSRVNLTWILLTSTYLISASFYHFLNEKNSNKDFPLRYTTKRWQLWPKIKMKKGFENGKCLRTGSASSLQATFCKDKFLHANGYLSKVQLSLDRRTHSKSAIERNMTGVPILKLLLIEYFQKTAFISLKDSWAILIH